LVGDPDQRGTFSPQRCRRRLGGPGSRDGRGAWSSAHLLRRCRHNLYKIYRHTSSPTAGTPVCARTGCSGGLPWGWGTNSS